MTQYTGFSMETAPKRDTETLQALSPLTSFCINYPLLHGN